MTTISHSEPDLRLGVIAFGDSITNGGGDLQWGVALQSWALWVARGLGLPYTPNAVDGATCSDVVRGQIPAFERHAAHPQARYELGCLYIGTNDLRLPGWDAEAFAADFATALEFLGSRCDRTLTLTIPHDLGRPRALAPVVECQARIEAVARRHGTLILDLSSFRGRNLVMSDHVHPSAFGQLAIAERALAVLAADGMAVSVWPAALIDYQESWWGRLHGDLRYAYRHAKVSAAAFRQRSGSPT